MAQLQNQLTAALTTINELRAGQPTQVLVTGYWNVFADGRAAFREQGAGFVRRSRNLTEQVNVALFSAAGHWNSWFDALLYVTRSRLLPLQMVLQMIIRGAQTVQLMTRAQYGMAEAKAANFTVESVRAATICFAVIPILCVYPFVQRYFVSGVMLGSVKG